jgi:hypothetical protein
MVDNRINDYLVNGQAFNDTFGNPGATMIGLIVAIYEGKSPSSLVDHLLSDNRQLDVSSVLSPQRRSVSRLVVARALQLVASL